MCWGRKWCQNTLASISISDILVSDAFSYRLQKKKKGDGTRQTPGVLRVATDPAALARLRSVTSSPALLAQVLKAAFDKVLPPPPPQGKAPSSLVCSPGHSVRTLLADREEVVTALRLGHQFLIAGKVAPGRLRNCDLSRCGPWATAPLRHAARAGRGPAAREPARARPGAGRPRGGAAPAARGDGDPRAGPGSGPRPSQ